MKKLILLIGVATLVLSALAQEEKTSPATADVASTIRQLEERWEGAVVNQNSKTVGELLASDYAGVNEKGEREDKATLLSRMDKEKETLSSAKITDLKVQVYSANVAVAIGDTAEKGKDESGKAFDRISRFTDTWMERDGKWQCIAEQASELKGVH
jgi:ketosteroid isomerase-like protein